MTALGKRHRPHAKADEPASSRVPGIVVGRHGGSGQDEVPGALAIIDRSAYVIPDRRLELPFVDEPGALSVQDERGICSRGEPGLRVEIETNLAARGLTRRLCLPAGLGAFDQHRSDSIQCIHELCINDPGSVQHGRIVRAAGLDVNDSGGCLRRFCRGVCETRRVAFARTPEGSLRHLATSRILAIRDSRSSVQVRESAPLESVKRPVSGCPLGGKTRPGRELRGYTTGMKTAVSVPDEVYAQAEELARRTGRTRSEIYSTALRDYLADHQPVPVTAAMDQALDAIDPEADPFLDAAAHETLAGVEW